MIRSPGSTYDNDRMLEILQEVMEDATDFGWEKARAYYGTTPHANRHTSPSQGMSCLSRKCFMSDSHPSTQPTDSSLASRYAGLRQRMSAATCVHKQPFMPTRRPHWWSGSRDLSTYARGIRGTWATSAKCHSPWTHGPYHTTQPAHRRPQGLHRPPRLLFLVRPYS